MREDISNVASDGFGGKRRTSACGAGTVRGEGVLASHDF